MLGASYGEFERLILNVTRLLCVALRKSPGASPMLVVVQRRYITQRPPAILDGVLRFDPRTEVSGGRGVRGRVKQQPQWLRAVYDLLKKRRSNLQFQIGADFPYDRCNVVATPQVKDAAVSVWLACKPLVQAVTEYEGTT
jgi:hypothetical protein